ncbi:MAG TPA: hypothetical protein VHT91_04040 [Kofleriaceae bacterium]|jgi:hypothetical protein|nr:hypothetical protein [Kofleriaceae bacterium]
MDPNPDGVRVVFTGIATSIAARNDFACSVTAEAVRPQPPASW